MTVLAALLVSALLPQDEARFQESWPKLVDAWKAVESYKPAPDAGSFDDEFLKVAAKIHSAFESAGLFAAEGEYLPQAVKALVKLKARGIAPAPGFGAGVVMFRRRLDPGTVSDGDPLATLLASLKKLQSLKAGGLDDEENVQDELATARKSLKALGITANETPAGLRRRALHLVKALALGEAYPVPAVATEEQAKQVRAWIADLGHESIETREAATKELLRAGEAALPFAREALKSQDAEVSSRARLLLGYGHAPWTKVKPAGADGTFEVDFAFPVMAAPPPPPPKEEKK